MLKDKLKKKQTKGKIWKIFGAILLTTKFKFKSRASLWSTTASSKYKVAPTFGLTGVSRQTFDAHWMCIHFSNQPKPYPPEMLPEQYHWKLVDDFVSKYNKHGRQAFHHLNCSVLTRAFHNDMVRAATVLIRGYHCTLRSIVSQRMTARSRRVPVERVEWCWDWSY